MAHKGLQDAQALVASLGIGLPLLNLALTVHGHTFKVSSFGKSINHEGMGATHLLCDSIDLDGKSDTYALIAIEDEIWTMQPSGGIRVDFVPSNKRRPTISFELTSGSVVLSASGVEIERVAQQAFDNSDRIRLSLFSKAFGAIYQRDRMHMLCLLKYRGIPGTLTVCESPCVFDISCEDGTYVCQTCSWWNGGCWM